MIPRRLIVVMLLLLAIVVAWGLSCGNPTEWRWAEIHWEGQSLCISSHGLQVREGQLWADGGASKFFIPRITARRAEQSWRKILPPYKRTNATLALRSPGLSSFAGFAIQRYNFRSKAGHSYSWGVGVPLWFFAALCLIDPLRIWMRRWVAGDRGRRGLCPACGYDLRASNGVCPECGAAPSALILAPNCGPAMAAVARSSGTWGVIVLAIYMAAACFLVSLTGWGWGRDWTTPVYAIYFGAAMVLILAGAFHAAGYSRTTEAFFTFGGLGGLLLLPVYVQIGRYCPPLVQAGVSIGCVIALGLLCRACAIARWRWQDRAEQPTAAISGLGSEIS